MLPVANIFQTLFTEFPVETALNSCGSFKRNLKKYKYYSLEHCNPSFLGESVYFLYITFKLLKVLKKSTRFSSPSPALVCIHVYQDLWADPLLTSHQGTNLYLHFIYISAAVQLALGVQKGLRYRFLYQDCFWYRKYADLIIWITSRFHSSGKSSPPPL